MISKRERGPPGKSKKWCGSDTSGQDLLPAYSNNPNKASWDSSMSENWDCWADRRYCWTCRVIITIPTLFDGIFQFFFRCDNVLAYFDFFIISNSCLYTANLFCCLLCASIITSDLLLGWANLMSPWLQNSILLIAYIYELIQFASFDMFYVHVAADPFLISVSL